ncbi:MAG: OmpA family protein [Bdellovibrionota bacterium]
MKLVKILSFLLILLILPQAHARYGQGGWLFGGIGAGGVMVGSSEPSDINVGQSESDKLGYAIHLKGGLSWYIAPAFVIDFMGGYYFSDVSGDAPSTGAEAVSIQHRVGLFQISPRFRFGDLGRWQIGPLYKLHFGTDTNYRERQGQDAGDEPMTHYLGAHLNYDIPSETEKTIYRFGVEALTDISDSRTILQANLLFEIGFNLWDGESTYEEPEQLQEEVYDDSLGIEENLPPLEEELLPAEEPDPNEVSAQASGNAVLIRFPGDRFQFATGMSHIGSAQTREYVRELGEFFARNDEAWEKVRIVGHTDRRGPKGRERVVNMELSEARARTVFNAMVAAGMNPAKMRYEGRAFDEPVPGATDDAAGWKLNRRVEITVEGVRAPEQILEQINELNRKYGYGRERVSET